MSCGHAAQAANPSAYGRDVNSGLLVRRDHHRAIGPSKIEPASKLNIANHADAVFGPPARSSVMPAPHAPSADNPKPTVVCIAIVAPLRDGTALMAIPE